MDVVVAYTGKVLLFKISQLREKSKSFKTCQKFLTFSRAITFFLKKLDAVAFEDELPSTCLSIGPKNLRLGKLISKNFEKWSLFPLHIVF